MGGHRAGKVASRLTIDGLKQAFNCLPRDPIDALAEQICRISRRIYSLAQENSRLADMGSTLVMALVEEDRFWVFHVGDSRAYLLRRNEILRLTNDHSLVADAIQKGAMTESDAATSPYRHALLQCIGHRDDPRPTIYGPAHLCDGDVLLLCSDGLSNSVTELEMLEALEETCDLQKAAKSLLHRAYRSGSDDNISVGLLEKGSFHRRTRKRLWQ
jgi:protein phosphatase